MVVKAGEGKLEVYLGGRVRKGTDACVEGRS